MGDTIADLLTRIRNAQAVRHPRVTMPGSNLKKAVATCLHQEGWVGEITEHDAGGKKVLQIELKYDDYGVGVIRGLQRVSTPGRRMYMGYADLPYVKSGLGTVLVSTSKGVMTGREARMQKLGGELLCKVW